MQQTVVCYPLDYVAERIVEIYKHHKQYKGFKISYESPMLRHFTAHFEPMAHAH